MCFFAALRTGCPVVCFVCALALLWPAAHTDAATETVLLGETFCSDSPRVCLRGSVEYDYDRGTVTLQGRVKQTRARGTLVVVLDIDGRDLKHSKRLKLAAPIRGRSFDLIKASSRFPAGKRFLNWSVRKVYFSDR